MESKKYNIHTYTHIHACLYVCMYVVVRSLVRWTMMRGWRFVGSFRVFATEHVEEFGKK